MNMRNRYDFQIAQVDDTSENDNENGKTKNSMHSVSYLTAITFLILLLGLYGIAYAIQEILPKPLTLADEKTYPHTFNAERAQQDLKSLTDLGPRVVGSYENEVLAVEFLKREIGIIAHEAHDNHTIEVDVQVVSGSYFLNYKPSGVFNVYTNVQNVVVKVSGENGSRHGVLVNAHFDSVPTSPGGSDDGINCAVMLEVLRKITRSSKRPKHNVVFLFNGAEETPLQASHGFITQHKWAKIVNVVINLEAAGAGGRIVLFQTGPARPWLMKYYSRVPHPWGQVTGEELFQSNVIPSDTDFRIFRDFGGLIGYDMAFVKNGYRYHTKYDGLENIPLGSFQHVGDNALSLVRDLSNAPELSNPEKQSVGHVTFYDVFGLFVISYNDMLALILNTLGVTLSVVAFVKSVRDFSLGYSKQTYKYVGITFAFTFGGWVLAAGVVMTIAAILDWLNYALSWYRNPWLVMGLYVVPIVATCCGSLVVMNHFFAQHKLSLNIQTQIQAHVSRSLWTIVLLVGTFLGVRSVYMILLPVTFNSVTFILIHIFKTHHSVRIWQIIYVLGTIIPTLFLMVNAIVLQSFIVPICGRIGNNRNPEAIVGLVTLLVTLLIMWVYVPLITLVRKSWIVVSVLAVAFLIHFVIVFTPLGFQYSGNPNSPAPERFWIFHHQRVFKNESNHVVKSDAGFFLVNFDRNAPKLVKRYMSGFEKAVSVQNDCKTSVFCGLPVISPRQIALLEASTWIPAGRPVLSSGTNFTLNSKTIVGDGLWRYNVTVEGPDRMGVYISPLQTVKLTNLSLVPSVPTSPELWNGREVFYFLRVWGKTPEPLEFTFDVQVPQDWGNETVAAELVVNAMYVHGKQNRKTPQFEGFLKGFPDWVDVVAFLGAFESWFV